MCKGSRLHCVAALVTTFFVTVGATAEVVALAPVKDNTLFEHAGGALSSGAGNLVFLGVTGSNGGFGTRRSLLAFDVAGSVPAGATIDSAELRLSLFNTAPGSGPRVVTVHRVLADWGESGSSTTGGSGAPAHVGDATWLHKFFPNDLWTAPGGDFSAKVSASQTTNFPGDYTWGPSSQLAADIQEWVDNPGANFGWMLRGDEGSTHNARGFGSREIGAPQSVPILTVTYSVAAAPGDCDGDSDIDGQDYDSFLDCVTGPDGGPPGASCGCVDLDEDGDIDFTDFGLFQRVFSGM